MPYAVSRGSVRLSGPGLDDKLVIDHRYLSDPRGYDRARLAEGVERAREVAAAPELRRLLGQETRPGPQVSGRRAIERFIDAAAVHYYHPAGSCKMGPASDPDSVADSEGRVHGIDGLYVADASLMPAVTSGNTNMPTTVIGERIARSLLGLPRRPPVLVCVGLAIGWRVHTGAADVIAAFALVLLFGYAFTWAGIWLGMTLRSPEAVHLYRRKALG